jgi:N-acetylneuraminic acid mutarotase
MGVATDGTDVYFAGGYPVGSGGTSQTFSTTAVRKYSPSTNTWASLPSLPAPRGAGALAIVGRTLHFFGGADANRADTTVHWTLNVDTGTSWTTAAPMAAVRNHFGAVTIGGKIYLVAGQQGQDAAAVYSNSVAIFDPATGSWTTAPSLPTARSHHGAATFVSNGKIVVLGGERAFGVPVSEVDVFDPVTNAWGPGTNLPAMRDSGIAGVINGVLYYTGGDFSVTTYKGVVAGSG